MSNYPEELHSLFQVRDALQLLCDKGFDLHALLDQCEQDIATLTKPWTTEEILRREA